MDLFGPGFSRAAPALALVLVVPAIATMSTIQTDALMAVGRPLATTVLAGARLATTVPLTIVLDSHHGRHRHRGGRRGGRHRPAGNSGRVFEPTCRSRCWPCGRLANWRLW